MFVGADGCVVAVGGMAVAVAMAVEGSSDSTVAVASGGGVLVSAGPGA